MTPDPGPSQEVVFSRQTAVRLRHAIRNFAISEVGTRAAALVGLLLAFLFTINALNVVNSYVGRYFMTAIERRDSHEFVRQALFYVGVFAASTMAAVLYRFTEERLGLLWREWLTRRLVGQYLAGQVSYRVEVTGTLANPDQRIADDVRSFTTSPLSLFLVFLNGTITMLAFSGVLWSISRLLFVVAVGYAALGSLCAVVLGRPLVRLSALAEAIAARGAAGIVVTEADEPRLAIAGLTLRTPQDGRVLVRDLSVEVPAGGRLLVTAPNDVVVAALQRAIVGIWESGEGRIVRPGLDNVLLLPDRPYLPPGTLRELLVGIEPAQPVPDDRIWEVLRLVAVEEAARRAGGLDSARDWRDALSLEEQLLVGVARLLLAAPQFAVLAPLAPSLGADRAAHILAALTERDVGYIVLGDGELSRDLFDAIVDIRADGTWTHTPSKEDGR